MNDKVSAYIGFAIKKGSVLFGCDCIERTKRKVYAILYTPSISENSLSVLRKVGSRVHCDPMQIDDYEALRKRNCKALAVCDKSLADAIKENLM